MMSTTPRRPEAGLHSERSITVTNTTKTASGSFRRLIGPDGAANPLHQAAAAKAPPPAAKPRLNFAHLREAAGKWPTAVFAAVADAAKAEPSAAAGNAGFVGRMMAADKKRRGEASEEAPAPGSLAARLIKADARRRGEAS